MEATRLRALKVTSLDHDAIMEEVSRCNQLEYDDDEDDEDNESEEESDEESEEGEAEGRGFHGGSKMEPHGGGGSCGVRPEVV